MSQLDWECGMEDDEDVEEYVFREQASAFSGWYYVHQDKEGYTYARYEQFNYSEWNVMSAVLFSSSSTTASIELLKAACQEHYDSLKHIPGIDRPKSA